MRYAVLLSYIVFSAAVQAEPVGRNVAYVVSIGEIKKIKS